ncbi:hypothetical protein HHI36_013667 [Cryptolaemus montrouzieri]|uniref:Uncharacterized protein n=1 Tax=Cryptolaemus montrouzieri TaxID=559131 RepID=A0ABD2NJ61_9CUCU
MQYDYLLFNFEIIQNVEKEFNGNILHFVMYGMYVFSAYLKEGKLQQSRQCFEKVVAVMPDSKEWLSFKDVLSICRYMVHSKVGEDNLSTCRDALLDCVKVYGNSENFRNICKVISLTVNSYNSFHKSHESEIFFDDSNQLLMFYEIINEVMAFFTYNAEPCKKKCECSTKKNVPEGNKVAIIISNLFILHSSKNIISEEIIMKVIDYLKRYCKFLCFLKSNKCEKWDTYWLDIEVYLHNIGVILLRKENYDKLFQVGHMILKYNSVLRKMENGKVISNTMGLLSSAYFKQKNYAKALTWAAMEVVNTKESIRDKVLYKLIKIKAEARDKDNLSSVQEFTIVSVIEDIPVGYEFYVKDISNDRQAQINLLTSELELYYEKWKSKVPMMSAFRQLTKIADNLTVMKVFIKMFCDWEIRVHENVVKLSEKIFEEFELSLKNSVSVEHRIFMVFVNFFKYKSKTSETIEKNIEEMRKIIKVLKAPSHPVDIMPADAYDQCDVVSAYEGLKIGRKEFDYLKLALQELEKICAIGISKSSSFFGIFDIEKLYSLAKNIALEYGLHSDVYHSLKALSLALNIAEISENKHFVLECGGYLLKYLQNSELEKMMEK